MSGVAHRQVGAEEAGQRLDRCLRRLFPTASQGLTTFVAWIAIISTAIGFLNLFPIPILDGGHFVAFLIEAVRGRPPSPAAMQVAMSIGLGLILLLMVFATYNDIMRMVS